MTDAAHGRLASIIIPCWNQLEFTRVCLSTLVRHTRAPWELIVIDNSPQMAQMDADEKTGNTGNPETNGHQTGSQVALMHFICVHLRNLRTRGLLSP